MDKATLEPPFDLVMYGGTPYYKMIWVLLTLATHGFWTLKNMSSVAETLKLNFI